MKWRISRETFVPSSRWMVGGTGWREQQNLFARKDFAGEEGAPRCTAVLAVGRAPGAGACAGREHAADHWAWWRWRDGETGRQGPSGRPLGRGRGTWRPEGRLE